jgi:hypothetical protein
LGFLHKIRHHKKGVDFIVQHLFTIYPMMMRLTKGRDNEFTIQVDYRVYMGGFFPGEDAISGKESALFEGGTVKPVSI